MKTRIAEERILFDNYYSEERFEYAKGFLIELAQDEGNEDYEPTDSEVFDQMAFNEETEWDDFKTEFEGFINNAPYGFIVTGSVGRWNGRFDGGTVIDSFRELTILAKDCDYLKFYDKNGHLYFDCSHHDGTNYFEIRELTEKGKEYYENHHIYDYASEYCPRLFNDSHYSHLPRYAEKTWGCKRVAYVKE